MTKGELNQLYWLNKETAQLQKDLAELRHKEIVISPSPNGMPRGSGKQDKIGDYVAEIMILEDTIRLNLQKIYYERNRIECYISDIPDSEMRLIMRLRHINGMTFEQIGDEVGYTKSGVIKKHKRYLESVTKFTNAM